MSAPSQPPPSEAVEFETVPDLASIPFLRHGFFGRAGGTSLGIYRGLNVGLGSQDDAAHVRANRQLVLAALGCAADDISTVHQIHSARCVYTNQTISHEGRPKADALVTDRPNVALSVLTADCCPVLFADPQARIIGAAHAGWRGASGGVLEATIDLMVSKGANPRRIIAGIGPTISLEHYEVGPEFEAQVMAHDHLAAPFFHTRADWAKVHFDLPGYVDHRVRRAGLWTVQRLYPGCTYSDSRCYFSYRRACHNGETDYGRQVATICISE